MRWKISTKQWNHNLVATFIFRITFSISLGLWNSGTGSNYIYYLEGESNTLVGVIQGLQGICIPLGSFPGGYIADRTRRDIVLRAFGVSGFIAIAFMIGAVVAPKVYLEIFPEIDIKYILLCAGYCFWGITQASNSIVESILADSVPTGGRSAVYTALFFLGMLGRSIGPLAAALVFIIDGNVWRVSTLGKAIVAGMLASIIPILALFFFNDNRSLGIESEAHNRTCAVTEGQSATTGSIDTKAPPKPSRQRPHLWCWSEASIPYILSCSDIIYGLASGCTIKFFPIFFAKEVNLTPIAVNVLMAAQPVVIGLCATGAQWLSQYTGRVQVLLLLRLVGFSIMGVMGIFTSLWTKADLIVFLFLVRTAVNNAGYPIQKAVLMDYVPKSSRGRWSAVDSIAAFGWSGSAFIGGILVDHVGFDWCFLITAIAQCSGWLVLFPLLALVPRKEIQHTAAVSDATMPLLAAEGGTTDEEGGLEDGSTELDLDSQQEALRADLDDVAPLGQRPMAIRTAEGSSSNSNVLGDQDFVKLFGTLKSPRRSSDTFHEH